MRRRLGVVLGLFVCATASAAPLARGDVPEPLRPWIDWALRGHEDARCPFLGTPDARRCAWPSRLVLTLDDRGGRFTQDWLVSRADEVPLPGDESRWPQAVRVDDRPAVVTARDGVPVVHLEPGTHTIGGAFEWGALPELLPTPAATGLVALTLAGEPVPFPRRDGEGRLWLRARSAETDTESRLDLVVTRLLTDDVPATLTTRLELRVAGRSREVVLAPPLPAGFAPLGIESVLPARVEPDGRLRLQVRPGAWTLTVVGRHEGPATAIALAEPDGAWVAEEVWAFAAVPALRQVRVEGVDAVDPTETALPPGWRRLPAYRVRPGDTMTLVETRRGDADAPADRLALERTWWLDFDGGGYTVHDRVTGTMAAEWRLEMAPPLALGHASVNGADEAITRRADGAAGLEVRDRTVAVEADARLDGGVRRLPATGWLHDFTSESAVLNLPPGWRLFHARGVDAADPTWVGRWTLLDLFIVLVTAMATLRLYGARAGAVALAAVGLTYLEPASPGAIWLAFLGAEALVRVLPAGRVLAVARALRLTLLVGVVVSGGPYVFREARLALHPALETVPAIQGIGGAVSFPAPESRSDESYDRLKTMRKGAVANEEAPQRLQRYAIDPSLRVQTGPGRPAWTWNRIALRWQGPVERTQEVVLYLVPPWANRLLGVLRGALVVALFSLFVRGLRARPSPAVALALALAVCLAPGVARAELPGPQLLDELRDRLLAPPTCVPTCVGIDRMALEATRDRLRLRLDVAAAAAAGLPLPGGAQDWTPAQVVVDGRPAAGLARAGDGRLWLALEPGRHDVLLDGALPARDAVSLALPERPRRVTAALDGWTIAGVRDDDVPEDTLQLARIAPGGAATHELEPATLPPFVRVTRRVRLGLTWEVETTVERLSPGGAALALELPLLEGEAVTTGGLHVAAGRVAVGLAPQATTAGWRSVLEQRETIALAAPQTLAWVETWSLDAGPMWHVEVDGVPVVQPDASEARAREWRPWPGETVTVRVSRPAAVPGPTLTIERSRLVVHPGLRATDVELTLTVRSSQGGRHRIGLPAGALLQSVAVDGTPQPIRQEGDGVVLPVVPGTQELSLGWREGDGVRLRFASPAVDLGAPSVNATTEVAMPPRRWVLLTGGPLLGPAVLFWSTLAVIALAAIGLGRTGWTPCGAVTWFLVGVGLSQVSLTLALVVVGWFLALEWRRRADLGPWAFDLRQLLLVPWTLAALAVLFYAVQQGLLGAPEMQIAGNGSTAGALRWFVDRAAPVPPRAWVLSVPLFVYRAAMLGWSVWIATALVGRWLGWAWESFSTGGLWRPLRRRGPA